MHTTKFKIDHSPLTSCKPTNLSRTIFLPKEAGVKLQDFHCCRLLIGIILIMLPPHLHKVNYRTTQNYLNCNLTNLDGSISNPKHGHYSLPISRIEVTKYLF